MTLSIGGQSASIQYAGRTPCCSGVDEIVATVPNNVPLGCWVPLVVNAGGVVSNTATMAIAAAGAASCDDSGSPLSLLARTPGTQAFIHWERIDSVENVDMSPAVLKTLDKAYSRFYSRPDSPYNFDPYLSYPPAGSCLVHQTSGDSYSARPSAERCPGASLSPQPEQLYNNGKQILTVTPTDTFLSSTLGGTVGATAVALNPLGSGGSFTIHSAGANTVIPLNLQPPPAWSHPNAIVVVPRSAPLALAFIPGDSGAPTVIVPMHTLRLLTPRSKYNASLRPVRAVSLSRPTCCQTCRPPITLSMDRTPICRLESWRE